jgi:hypothetical protein
MDVKAKLANLFDDEETSFPVRVIDCSPYPTDRRIKQKSLDDQKLTNFAHGSMRKSRREKEKEAQEAKTREEESLTAKAYEDFLETFEGDGSNRPREGPGFVRQGSGGSYGPTARGRAPLNAPVMDDEEVGPYYSYEYLEANIVIRKRCYFRSQRANVQWTSFLKRLSGTPHGTS